MGKKKTILCCECNSILAKDYVALSRKLLGRSITQFYCITILAKYRECEVGDHEINIMEIKEQGCALFL
jgi:hypothetical protein